MTRDWPYYFLVIISSVIFIFNGQTAFDTSLNIYPFLERYFDSTFLLNDFYTNAVFKSNPYHIFGFVIIFLSKTLNIEWYTAVYILKIIIVVFNPIIYYSFFNIMIRSLGYNANKILLLVFVIILISPLSKLFSIAWWPPYSNTVIPQTFGISLSLLSFIIWDKKYYFLAILFILFASLLHPVVALYTFIFVFSLEIFYLKTINNKSIIFLSTWLLASIIIYMLFPTKSIPNNDFVNLYAIENHSSHYHLSDFGSYLPSIINWKISYLFITISFIIIYFISNYVHKKNSIKKLVILVLTMFNLAILLQYIFIDIFPLRIVAIFSPIRYTSSMFWYFIILSVILLSNKKNLIIKVNNRFNLSLFTLIILSYFVFFIDSPKERLYSNNKDFYDFVKTTSPNSIFSLPPTSLNFEFSYVSNRSTFHGVGFPFNQDFLYEYTERKNYLFGKKNELDLIKGNWIGEKQNVFYGSLTPDKIRHIRGKFDLDYLVFYKKYLKNTNQFDFVFETDELAVYYIN